MERPGRYTLMGLVPYEWNIAARNRTAFTLVSGDQTETFTVDQTIRCGEWRELGTFEMAPGATLTLHPEKSIGTVFADAFAVVPFKGE